VYSAPNPFEAFNDPCPQQPVSHRPLGDPQIRVSNRHLPIYHVHNACDIAGICPNGEFLITQLRLAHARVTDVIIDDNQNQVTTCDPKCGTNPDADLAPTAQDTNGFTEGSMNHTRWPSNWTEKMLQFMAAHRGRRSR
jgi:hypothetical protein